MVSNKTSLDTLLTRGASGPEIAAYLNELSSDRRMVECLAVTGFGVKRLYETVAGNRAVEMDDILGTEQPADTTVVFEGRNSLPMLSRFQKRFARVESGEIVGYNRQRMQVVTGPGYFVVRAPCPSADVPDELWFDYTAVPPTTPSGWPRFRPNDWGPSRAVFMGLKDYMRHVASGVMVGKAYKNGVPEGAFFTLCRVA